MDYSTNDDILKQISEDELAVLTGDDTGAAVDWERVEYARGNADGLINSYLWDRYPVPLSDPVPAIVSWLSAELTVINLFQYSYKDTALPNAAVWRKIDAMKLLRQLQDGTVALMLTGENPPNSPLLLSNKTGNNRLFSDDVLEQFGNI